MPRIPGFVFAVFLFAIGASTSVLAASPDWPQSLTLATASPGGVYYVYGEAVAKILTESLGIPVNHLPTQGPVHNVKLIESNGAQFGFSTLGVALQGWNGTGAWTSNQQFRTMRALFPMYDTPFQAVALRRSNITALIQLKDKPIGVGPRASTGGTYIPDIMKSLGISVRINNGAFATMGGDLIDGQATAIITLVGAPLPAIQEAEAKEPLTFIELTAAENETIRKAFPELSPSILRKGTYAALTEDYATVGVYNFAIGRADLPDDLVYRIVKAVFDHQPQIAQAHETGKELLPQNAEKNTFMSFHPGAVRYYREIGINIPNSLSN
jgi:TRAP transporter TAXI family solute receptor